MFAIAPIILGIALLTVPAALVVICVAIMRGERSGGAPISTAAVLALIWVLFVLIYIAYAGYSSVGSG